MAYATSTELKRYLGITGAGDDSLLDGLLIRASAAIDIHTGRTFEAATATARTFDAIGSHISGPELKFDKLTCSISSITNGDGTSISASEYVTMPRNEGPFYGVRLKTQSGKVWTYSTDWEDAITVTAKWADYETPPPPVVEACLQYAMFLYRRKDAPTVDVTAIEAGVVMTTPGIPSGVLALLASFKRAG